MEKKKTEVSTRKVWTWENEGNIPYTCSHDNPACSTAEASHWVWRCCVIPTAFQPSLAFSLHFFLSWFSQVHPARLQNLSAQVQDVMGHGSQPPPGTAVIIKRGRESKEHIIFGKSHSQSHKVQCQVVRNCNLSRNLRDKTQEVVFQSGFASPRDLS